MSAERKSESEEAPLAADGADSDEMPAVPQRAPHLHALRATASLEDFFSRSLHLVRGSSDASVLTSTGGGSPAVPMDRHVRAELPSIVPAYRLLVLSLWSVLLGFVIAAWLIALKLDGTSLWSWAFAVAPLWLMQAVALVQLAMSAQAMRRFLIAVEEFRQETGLLLQPAGLSEAIPVLMRVLLCAGALLLGLASSIMLALRLRADGGSSDSSSAVVVAVPLQMMAICSALHAICVQTRSLLSAAGLLLLAVSSVTLPSAADGSFPFGWLAAALPLLGSVLLLLALHVVLSVRSREGGRYRLNDVQQKLALFFSAGSATLLLALALLFLRLQQRALAGSATLVALLLTLAGCCWAAGLTMRIIAHFEGEPAPPMVRPEVRAAGWKGQAKLGEHFLFYGYVQVREEYMLLRTSEE